MKISLTSRRLRWLLLAALIGALLVAAPAVAHATPSQDDAFYDSLYSVGIVPGPGAITGAHMVCSDVWSGTPPYTEVSKLWRLNKSFTWDNANDFVFHAIRIYCPPTGSGYSSSGGQTV